MSMTKRLLEYVQLEEAAKEHFLRTVTAFEEEINDCDTSDMQQIDEFFGSAYAVLMLMKERVDEEQAAAYAAYRGDDDEPTAA